MLLTIFDFLFQMDFISECVLQKLKQLHLSEKKLSKVQEKDTILHMQIAFF